MPVDQKDKIPLKTDILRSNMLEKRVESWMENFNPQSFKQRHRFKNFPSLIDKLPQTVMKSGMIYAVRKRLPGLLFDPSVQMSELSTILRDYYSSTYMENNTGKGKDICFYFLCVFMTKQTITFLSDTFFDLLVQIHLEAEIYITFVHAMLGIQICPKTYEVQLKQFIKPKPRPSHKHNTYFSNFQSMSSVHSRSKLKRLNTLSMPLKKLLVKLTIERKGTHDQEYRDQPSIMESFRTTLKQNLQVKALPRIPPKLLKASQFDLISDLNEAAKQGDEKKFIFTRRENEALKPPPDYLRSTQNSSSFEAMLRKTNQMPITTTKTVKISHRPQLINHKRSSLSLNLVGNQSQQEQKQYTSKVNSGRKNWDNIIKNIKQNVVSTSKQSFETRAVQSCQQTPDARFIDNSTFTPINQPEGQDEVAATESAGKGLLQMQKIQASTRPSVKPAPFFTYWLDHAQTTNSQAILQPLNSHKFRQLRKQFDWICEKRHEQASESMFNIKKTVSLIRRR